MISFDVVSLFTSIPLPTAKRITDQLLTTNPSWKDNTKLTKSGILNLLNLCLSTEIQFEGSFYQQISSTPMGSPLSSFLAEAVMQDLEHQVLLNNTEVKLWDRYVDDVFSIVKTQHIRTLFDTINNITDRIAFTIEKEKDGQIAFLDVLLTRTDNGTIETHYTEKRHTPTRY